MAAPRRVARRRRIVTPVVEEALRDYFYRGYTAIEIHKMLHIDGIDISYSYLRSDVMPRLGLVKNRPNRPGAVAVAGAVMEAAAEEQRNALASTASMTRNLRVNSQMNVIRADVALAQRALDPASVQARRTGRLQRRAYNSQGANWQWHLDGYDKLAPYGLPIHGGIDGFSRFVLWLKLCTTNHRPEQTCSHFMEAVSNHCIPHSVRMDGGTENVRIILAQRYLCTGMPRLTTLPPVIVGSSNHNERIERFWGLFRQKKGNFWINHFKQLVAEGNMVPWDAIDRKVSYYVFNNLVRDDLDEMVKEHNDHRIRSQRNPEIITGKPNLLYRMPEKVGYRECGIVANPIKVAMAKAEFCGEVPFDPVFAQELDELIQQAGVPFPPTTIDEADVMYIDLRTAMHARA